MTDSLRHILTDNDLVQYLCEEPKGLIIQMTNLCLYSEAWGNMIRNVINLLVITNIQNSTT